VNAFRVEKLKEMCSNGIRTSHNPPTTELLDACDRLGMLVMDETRMMDSSPEGLSQLERLIRRDRNHPCVFLWSLGNEEREQGSARGQRIVTTMKRLAKKLDPTRLVTVAQNGGYGPVGISTVVDVGASTTTSGRWMDCTRASPSCLYSAVKPPAPCARAAGTPAATLRS